MTDRLTSRSQITQEYALECFEYIDGRLIWRARPAKHFVDEWRRRIFNARQAGTEAGSKSSGYMMVRFSFGKVSVHRLVYLMHHGHFPEEVDHIDGDKTNNRVENLRAATHAQNSRNTRVSSANSSGVKGVSFHAASGKWTAHVRKDGKQKYIGVFATIDDAASARKLAAQEVYGEFCNER